VRPPRVARRLGSPCSIVVSPWVIGSEPGSRTCCSADSKAPLITTGLDCGCGPVERRPDRPRCPGRSHACVFDLFAGDPLVPWLGVQNSAPKPLPRTLVDLDLDSPPGSGLGQRLNTRWPRPATSPCHIQKRRSAPGSGTATPVDQGPSVPEIGRALLRVGCSPSPRASHRLHSSR